jgi:hypothetical protein
VRARELLHEGFRSELSLDELARGRDGQIRTTPYVLANSGSRRMRIKFNFEWACQMIGAGVSLAEVAFAVR